MIRFTRFSRLGAVFGALMLLLASCESLKFSMMKDD